MLTLIKNYTDESKIQKRINVKKIASLADLLNQNYKSIKFKFKGIEELSKLKKLTTVQGETDVEVHLLEDDKTIVFKLKNKRKINNKLINSLNLSENIIV